MVDCDKYVFNPKKVKVKLNPNYARFQLNEIKVDMLDTLRLNMVGCDEVLAVVTQSGSLEDDLKNIIYSGYPETNSLKMNLHIKDLKLIDNKLPTSNPRLYLTIDFYLEIDNDNFGLKYSVTEFVPIAKYIEKPLARLIKLTIENFFKDGLINSYKEADTNTNDGVYTSFLD